MWDLAFLNICDYRKRGEKGDKHGIVNFRYIYFFENFPAAVS